MAPMEFHPVFKPTERRIKHNDRYSPFYFLLKHGFHATTICLLGAVGQAVLFTFLPLRWAVVPTAILTLQAVGTTIFQLITPARSGGPMERVVPGRTTAQLPSRETGKSGPDGPASEPLVVFHIGAQLNHPLGAFGPESAALGQRFTGLTSDALARADEYGLLGSSSWTGTERGSNTTFLTVMYFRDVEGLHRFAHDPAHRKAWDWWNDVKARCPHISIYHETFEVRPGAYETIYENMRPSLLGAASVRCKTEKGEEAWVNPLVKADNSMLRSQYGRMGRKE